MQNGKGLSSLQKSAYRNLAGQSPVAENPVDATSRRFQNGQEATGTSASTNRPSNLQLAYRPCLLLLLDSAISEVRIIPAENPDEAIGFELFFNASPPGMTPLTDTASPRSPP